MLDYRIGAKGDLYGFQLFDSRVIPFRLLNYGEYKVISSALDSEDVDDWVLFDYLFDKCVSEDYYKDYRETLEAGIVQTVALLIVELSSPGDTNYQNAMLVTCRTKSQQIDLMMKTTICRVFSGYTMDKLDELTFPEIIQVFTQAEGVLLDQGLISEPAIIYSLEEGAPAVGVNPDGTTRQINQKTGYGVVSAEEIAQAQKALRE